MSSAPLLRLITSHSPERSYITRPTAPSLSSKGLSLQFAPVPLEGNLPFVQIPLPAASPRPESALFYNHPSQCNNHISSPSLNAQARPPGTCGKRDRALGRKEKDESTSRSPSRPPRLIAAIYIEIRHAKPSPFHFIKPRGERKTPNKIP